MRKLIIQIVLTVFAIGAANVQAQPKTLDELLVKVQAGALVESKEYKERERKFLQAKNQQRQLLVAAERERDREEQRSIQLEATYNRQEEELAQLTDLLTKRLGSLRELFGVLQQVSGDARGKFETSIISAQYPDRGVFLANLAKKMGTATELATIEEIETVVFELQREMTESGKIVSFVGTVHEPDGDKVEKDIVRIGAFNLVADGKYLRYKEETGAIEELSRQPAGRFLSTADDIADADVDEYPRIALDPSRGSILAALVLAPSWIERATQQGGFIGWLIICGGGFGLLLAIWRWMAVGSIARKVNAQIASDSPSDDNPLGRVLAVYKKNTSIDTETLELKLGEAILKETPEIVKLISLLKIIAVVAPLMGLLGTVTGMINTFQAITLFGAGDPKLMAGGISQALVTTMLGLYVAIPMTLAHSVVNSRSKRVIHILEEQSAGIIAAHNERKGG